MVSNPLDRILTQPKHCCSAPAANVDVWLFSGQWVEEALLWDGGRDRVPLGLAHPRLPLVIANQLREFVSAQLGESYPSLVLPAIHLTIERLNLHVISASWDSQERNSNIDCIKLRYLPPNGKHEIVTRHKC